MFLPQQPRLLIEASWAVPQDHIRSSVYWDLLCHTAEFFKNSTSKKLHFDTMKNSSHDISPICLASTPLWIRFDLKNGKGIHIWITISTSYDMITVHLNNKISFSLPTYDIGHFELSSDIEISLVALNWELLSSKNIF